MAEPWTLAEAQEHLAAWLAADKAVASGQSYSIATRSLTRAVPGAIAQQIAFWSNEVARLQSGRSRGIRVMRVVPRDI